MDIQGLLVDKSAYERQIERLHQRSLLTSRLYELKQDDVPLAMLVIHRSKVARLLARDVRKGLYALQPGELRTIKVKNKEREVFACRMTDLIVHGVVARGVQEAVEPQVSQRVFSYRKGLSPLTPIGQLADYIRHERGRHGDPRKRGVFVLRRDVDSYTDSIPIGQHSPLWAMLKEGLGGEIHPLVNDAIRVSFTLPDGAMAGRLTGLPMGQPISSVIANLYLRDVDRVLQSVPGGFYARYGDDFLFAHPDPDVTREADAAADKVLDQLSLTVNEKKRRTIFLTPAGRRSDAWPEAIGAPYVPFLGTRITAVGTVGLDGSKIRQILRQLDRRIGATVAALRDSDDRDEVGRAVCAVVNAALDPSSALTQHGSAIVLRRVVTDRQQLHQLDHEIARKVATAVTGREGGDSRAFREVPYQTIRRRWGLRSLVADRNAVGRRRR